MSWSLLLVLFLTSLSVSFSVSYTNLGQARVSSGCFPSADGAVPGSARPCREDRISTEAVTRGRGPHQGGNLTGVHGEDTYLCSYTHRRLKNIHTNVPLGWKLILVQY